MNLLASNDLSLIGTEAQAQRNITLGAGNDLTIKSAQNDFTSHDAHHSGGAEAGIAVGQEGVGVYASVNIGRGDLKREGAQQQQASLTAGDQLSFTSGRDTTVSGATLRGDSVLGDVGRNLTVSSAPDTGKVTGKEFDLSATVVVGFGASVSGSVGYGQTTGSKDWVQQQTAITAKNDLSIRTQDHTQIDGGLIASDTGKLKLDTGTLGFSDIAGQDKEHAYYLNVGGTYGTGGSTAQDSSQVGKGDSSKNGWSVEGYQYDKDREQIVRATVGAGEVLVRGDAQSGTDSTAGLNRDVSKAYEITKDEEHRTDLYATKSSIDAVSDIPGTLQQWKDQAQNYGTGQIAELTQNVNQLRAATITVDDVPQSARNQLGNDKALEITKQLVIAGASDAQVATFYSGLNSILETYTKAEQCGGICQSDSLDGAAAPSGNAAGSGSGKKLELPNSYVTPIPYQDVFVKVGEFGASLPKEQLALGMFAVQVAMGGVIKVALNAVVNNIVGPYYDKKKEAAAIWLVATITGQSAEGVKLENDEGKAAYADGHQGQLVDGSYAVTDAAFLIDSLMKAVVGSAGKAIGRVVSVSGGAKEVAGTATTGGTKAAATEGTFPDEVFTGKKPHQTTPRIGSVTQERYNPATGKLEESVIEYDQYGRQVKRTDYTNHGYGNQEKPAEYHSDPHTHTYEYGPGYGSNGKETRINND